MFIYHVLFLNPWPLIVVSGVSKGYEDWLRHKADNEVNKYPVTVLEDGHRMRTESEKIKVRHLKNNKWRY